MPIGIPFDWKVFYFNWQRLEGIKRGWDISTTIYWIKSSIRVYQNQRPILTADLLTCMNAYTPRRNSMFDDPLPGDDLRGPPRPFLMYDGMLPVICDFSFCERGLERASDRVQLISIRRARVLVPQRRASQAAHTKEAQGPHRPCLKAIYTRYTRKYTERLESYYDTG